MCFIGFLFKKTVIKKFVAKYRKNWFFDVFLVGYFFDKLSQRVSKEFVLSKYASKQQFNQVFSIVRLKLINGFHRVLQNHTFANSSGLLPRGLTISFSDPRLNFTHKHSEWTSLRGSLRWSIAFHIFVLKSRVLARNFAIYMQFCHKIFNFFANKENQIFRYFCHG